VIYSVGEFLQGSFEGRGPQRVRRRATSHGHQVDESESEVAVYIAATNDQVTVRCSHVETTLRFADVKHCLQVGHNRREPRKRQDAGREVGTGQVCRS
jgi:hypothetical protein